MSRRGFGALTTVSQYPVYAATLAMLVIAGPAQAACTTSSTPTAPICANPPCGKTPPGVAAAISCNLVSAASAGTQKVIIYHAGSLSAAFTPIEKAFVCSTGIQVIDCSGGSLDLARQLHIRRPRGRHLCPRRLPRYRTLSQAGRLCGL